MKSQKVYKKNTLLALINVLFSASIAFSQPAAPSDLVVVPRYDGTITLVVSWTDNSNNEDGFRIEGREAGTAAWTFWATEPSGAGTGTLTYIDSSATSDKMWEYRVRANGAGPPHSGWTAVSDATSPRQEWPIDDGSHNILHNYGNPLLSVKNATWFYFHNGVDISAGGKQVNAGRGGIVDSTDNRAGGRMSLSVDFGTGPEVDVYAHVAVDVVWGANDLIAPGERIGTVRNNFFNMAAEADHTHWGSGRNNLLLFTNPADRDPNNIPPVVADANDDGDDFIVVAADNNDHSNPREPTWGEVDFLVDAYDDMAGGTNIVANPFNLGYWIQAGAPGGENVRNAATPYRLIQFDYPLVGPSAPGAVENAVMYWDFEADLQGIDTWQSYFTWIITNTGGTNGATANVDAGEFWKTDARKGTGIEPNGSDADKTRENQEAKFPDGTYFVHIILEDLVNKSDNVRSVTVDNSRPYVKKVTVYSGLRIVYQAQWVWDGGAAQLSIQPATFVAAAAFTALRTQDVTIEVKFSEPMLTASINSISPLGVTPTLTSTQSAHSRTIWKGIISNLDISDDGSDDGTHMITFAGSDLAGNQLLQINDRTGMGADHHNRNAAGNMQGAAGQDNIHGLRIGPLEGVIPVTAIFMKQTAIDPLTPTIADKALQLQQALNDYFDEVSYGEISFVIDPHGWYQLNHPLDWYYNTPQTPLIDLAQEAVSAAETDGVNMPAIDYVLVVTDETADRVEWSTNGAWPYTVAASPGWKLMTSGVINLASSDAHVTNAFGRTVGLIDLFAYPYVSYPRPFVGHWSHMSDKDLEAHVLGWEKWRAGWLDETGTATGKTLTRVEKPSVASPIANQTYTILPLDSGNDGVKMVAIEIGDRLHYTAEYRRQQNLDTGIPDEGVLIVKANDYINQGEGPAIVQESPVTSGNIDDATFNVISPRDEFDDVGSGVNIQVTSMNANQAEISLNYQIPPQENDVYVSPHDNRWKAEDIWIDAPDLADNFEANPLTVKDANEKPVVGDINKVYGRVRNQGHADATNFEVYFMINEPWGVGGPWDTLAIETVTLLQGQDHASNDYYLISVDWTPSGDVKSCVRLTVHGVANDINAENNWTQENISEFVTSPGSPYAPVTSRFTVENPYDETIPIFFKIDGLPPSWSYILTPERLVIPAGGVGDAQVTIQPHEAAPLCYQEQITISAYTPQVDALKSLGAITLQVALKNDAGLSMEAWVDCGKRAYQAKPGLIQYKRTMSRREQYENKCAIYTQGCTDPILPNTQVAVVYTAPDGEKQVHYVTTDENGCFMDMLTVGEPGLWQAQAVLEETDCRAEAKTPRQPVEVKEIGEFGRGWRYFACFGPNFPLGDFDNLYDPGFSLNGGIEYTPLPGITLAALLGFHQFYSPTQNQHFAQLALNLKYTYRSWIDKFAYIQTSGGQYRPRYGNNGAGASFGTGLTWFLSSRLGLDFHADYHLINYSQKDLDRATFIAIQMGTIWSF